MSPNRDAFVKELKINFRPYDESGDIESELVNLWLKDSQCISEYLVWFNSLAVRCSWGESTLRHRFYNGLPSCLKDDVSRGEGKPKDLLRMRQKVQNSNGGLYTPPYIPCRVCTDSEHSEHILSSHLTCVNVLGVHTESSWSPSKFTWTPSLYRQSKLKSTCSD